MSRSAVLVGRTASDVIYNAASLVIMALTGLIVGWRIHNGIVDALAGFGLLLLFAYAFSWVMAYVGLAGAERRGHQQRLVHGDLPAHVHRQHVRALREPARRARVFAEWNPVSAITQAARELFGNIPPGTPEPTVWPLQNPVLYTLIWIVVIIAVFAPLSVRRYRKAKKRG